MKHSRKLSCIIIMIMLVICLLSVSACNNNPFDDDLIAEPLISKPIAVADSENVVVLDSMTDGQSNYYLIDLGYVKDTYLSTLGQVEYVGLPIQQTISLSEEESTTYALQKTISNAITVENSQSYKTSISAGYSLLFNFEAAFEWNGVWTNLQTSEKSISDTTTTSKNFVKKTDITFSFGKNDAAQGKYRYALYADCDVYLTVKTSFDNSELLEINANVCARENTYILRMEYTEDEFINDVEGSINLHKDFYTKLPIPTKQLQVTSPTLEKLVFDKVVRTGETWIYNRNNHIIDRVEFSFGLSKAELEKAGYRYFDIRLLVDIKELEDSGDLYNGVNVEDVSGNKLLEWQRKRHRGDWETYVLSINSVEMNKLFYDEDVFKLKIEYYCKQSNFQDWMLGTVKLEISLY